MKLPVHWRLGQSFPTFFISVLFPLAAARISKIFPCPQKCECDIVTQRVDCSGAGLSTLPPSIPTSTRILLFKENKLEDDITIDSFNITTLTRLRHLSLANNSVTGINPEVVAQQEKIMKLDLSLNNLQSIPSIIRRMRQLKHLYLWSNYISDIMKDDFPASSVIEQVYLDDNDISRIQDGAFETHKQLRVLYLGGNSISNISHGLFARLESLIQLDLSHNRLGADLNLQYELLGDDIPTPKMVELGAGIQSASRPPLNFSDWFDPFGAKSLEYLNLTGNIIKTIAHDAFILFPVLKSLDLSNNEIISLPPNVLDTCDSIQLLNLSGNNISTFYEMQFGKATSLEELNISNNLLTVLPDTLFNANSKLLDLDLSANRLVNVTFLRNLRHLLHLYMHHNAISSVERAGFTRLVSLEVLELQHNQLESIPNVRNLTRLREIDLSYNSIQSIPYDVFDGNVALEVILLVGNMINTIREEPFNGLPNLHTVNAKDNPIHCDCNVLWLKEVYSYEYYYDYDYDDVGAEETASALSNADSSGSSAAPDWRKTLTNDVNCVKPNIAIGVSIKNALDYYPSELICNHFANPRSIMILILTWFLIVMVFLIIFWGRTFWIARKELGTSRHHKTKVKSKEEDACYVISSGPNKARNGKYQLLPDKNENEPLVFVHKDDEESCKLRTLDRSTEIFIETTV